MLKRRIRLLITALFAAGAIVPCSEDRGAEECGFHTDAVQMVTSPAPLEREMTLYRRDTVSLLAAGNYDGLEARARIAREQKRRFPNGIWELHQFYTALPLASADPEAAWEKRLGQISAWVAARPASLTASIALADAYRAYAWKARINRKEANGASDDATLFRERLEKGLEVLEDARSLGVQDPHYWRAAHGIAAGLGWPAANLDELYQNAVALEPDYWSNDVARLSALLARHGRDPEAIETFAAEAATAADEYGEQIYARAAWAVNEFSGSFLEESPFDWPRVQAGYRALLQRNPESIALLSEYCVLACRARDKIAARKCFVKLAGKADARAFKSPHGYLRHLRWANWN